MGSITPAGNKIPRSIDDARELLANGTITEDQVSLACEEEGVSGAEDEPAARLLSLIDEAARKRGIFSGPTLPLMLDTIRKMPEARRKRRQGVTSTVAAGPTIEPSEAAAPGASVQSATPPPRLPVAVPEGVEVIHDRDGIVLVRVPVDMLPADDSPEYEEIDGDSKLLPESVGIVGFLATIVVCVLAGVLSVLAGRGRVKTARKLGQSHMVAILFSDPDQRKQHLAELDENLARKRPSPAQRDRDLARRHALLQDLGYHKPGRPAAALRENVTPGHVSPRPLPMTQTERKAVSRARRRTELASPELAAAYDGGRITTSQIDGLVKLPKHEQPDALARLADPSVGVQLPLPGLEPDERPGAPCTDSQEVDSQSVAPVQVPAAPKPNGPESPIGPTAVEVVVGGMTDADPDPMPTTVPRHLAALATELGCKVTGLRALMACADIGAPLHQQINIIVGLLAKAAMLSAQCGQKADDVEGSPLTIGPTGASSTFTASSSYTLSPEVAGLAASRAAGWRVPLLEPIPAPGHATSADWKGTVTGTTRISGRNDPRVGRFLIERYVGVDGVVVDPMIGAAGLFAHAKDLMLEIHGTDCEKDRVRLAHDNLGAQGHVEVADARTWRPWGPVGLVVLSPPFQQNHSGGKTNHQQEMIEKKRLHQFQEFGAASSNIAKLRREPYFDALGLVYKNVSTYLAHGGRFVLILRNYIRRGEEQDEIALHLLTLRNAGFEVAGAHPRELEPTAWQQTKLARVPSTPYTRIEWALVCQLP